MAGRARERIFASDEYREFFPSAEFDAYDSFAGIRGQLLKAESRTRVVLVERQGAERPSTMPRRFVFKEYRYPWLPRLRTWLRISKAENEFNSLRRVRELVLPCAEAAAWGVKRTAFGFVRCCFIVTSFVEDSITLWESEINEGGCEVAGDRREICKVLGQNLRRLHEARLFLFTAKPKNILLRKTGSGTELFFIDLPYARFVCWRPVARWAQAKDLAVIFANYMPCRMDDGINSFYETYFPDPLGAPDSVVRKRVERAVRVRLNQTWVTALVHRLRRKIKKSAARLTAESSETKIST